MGSDVTLSCRFLVRLLLVHGTLADYRLGRLIKYSFYKNIAFAFMLFFFQFFCAYSGQALLDGITAVWILSLRARFKSGNCNFKAMCDTLEHTFRATFLWISKRNCVCM